MKRVIITGASGFIGGELSKYLLKDGVTVYGVGRNMAKLNDLKGYGDFHPVVASFEQYADLDSLINSRGFDWFYHFAWRGTGASVEEFNDYNAQVSNISTACDAASAAIRLGCNGISFCSSYQEANVAICDINSFNPVYYGIAKRCASEFVQAVAFQSDISCINFIFPNIYGTNDKQSTAIVYFIDSMLSNKPLNLISGVYPDDWMPVEDLVDGICAASQSGRRYANYYIGHRQVSTFKDKLMEMKRILGSTTMLNWGKYPEISYIDYSRFDLDALYRDTSWEARSSFAESILQTADWIKHIKKV